MWRGGPTAQAMEDPMDESTTNPAAAVSDDGRAVTRGSATAVVAVALVTVLVVVGQHVLSPIRDDDGDRVPVLDPELWRVWIPVLLGLVAIGVVATLRPYSRRTILTGVAADLALGVTIIALHLLDRLLNPALLRTEEWLDEPTARSVLAFLIVVGVAQAVGTSVFHRWRSLQRLQGRG